MSRTEYKCRIGPKSKNLINGKGGVKQEAQTHTN